MPTHTNTSKIEFGIRKLVVWLYYVSITARVVMLAEEGCSGPGWWPPNLHSLPRFVWRVGCKRIDDQCCCALCFIFGIHLAAVSLFWKQNKKHLVLVEDCKAGDCCCRCSDAIEDERNVPFLSSGVLLQLYLKLTRNSRDKEEISIFECNFCWQTSSSCFNWRCFKMKGVYLFLFDFLKTFNW